MATIPAINSDISDLFYNTDHANAAIKKGGAFQKWDHATIVGNAQAFLESMERLGIDCPSIDDLIDDFYHRQ